MCYFSFISYVVPKQRTFTPPLPLRYWDPRLVSRIINIHFHCTRELNPMGIFKISTKLKIKIINNERQTKQ